jgi:hypothetical protein
VTDRWPASIDRCLFLETGSVLDGRFRRAAQEGSALEAPRGVAELPAGAGVG